MAPWEIFLRNLKTDLSNFIFSFMVLDSLQRQPQMEIVLLLELKQEVLTYPRGVSTSRFVNYPVSSAFQDRSRTQPRRSLLSIILSPPVQ